MLPFTQMSVAGGGHCTVVAGACLFLGVHTLQRNRENTSYLIPPWWKAENPEVRW